MKSQDSDIENNSLLDAALVLQKNGEQKEALRLVKIILKSDPDQIEAAVLAGLIYQSLKENQNAELQFQLALSINSKYPNALKSWGLFLRSQDRKTEAVETLTQYLNLIKWDDQEILETLVELASETGSEEKGLEILKDAWEHTLNPNIGNRYCIQLQLKGEVEKSLPILEMLVKVSPEPPILNQLGIALQFDKQYEKAIQVYRQALKRADELKDEEDHVHYEKWVETASNSFEGSQLCESCQLIMYLWDNLSDCYLASGQKEDALEAAEHALSLDPSLDYSLQKKVGALLGLERYGEAKQIANQYLDRHMINDIDLKIFYVVLVDGLIEGQQKEEAIGYLKRALVEFPQESVFYYKLAILLEELGNLEEAAEVLKNVSNVPPETNSFELENPADKNFYKLKLYTLLDLTGQRETAWINLRDYFDSNPEELNSLLAFLLFGNLWAENQKEYPSMVHLIKQLYIYYPDHPVAVYLMSTLFLSRNDLQDGVTVLENIHKLQVIDTMKLVLLNNLGFGYMLQGKHEPAQKVLEQALSGINDDPLERSGEIFGIAFYIDGKFYTFNQIWQPISSSIILPGFYDLFNIDAIIKYNLIALALAKGDADQASALLADNMVSYINSEGYWGLNYMSLLCLARSRMDRITAIYAWKKILEMYETMKTINQELTEERLINLFPKVHSWLSAEAKGKQGD